MLIITYLNAAGQPFKLTYENYDAYERQQLTCLAPLADHYKVTEVTLNGHSLDYSGSFGDLYFYLNQLDKSPYQLPL